MTEGGATGPNATPHESPRLPPREAGSTVRLYERGVWIPGDKYWGEPGDVVPAPVVEVIAGGARRGYEFEQQLPGGDDPDTRDVIGEALALRDGGQHGAA